MAYIRGNLMPDERIEYEAHLHWIIYQVPGILALVAVAAFIVGLSTRFAFATPAAGVLLLLAAVAAGAAYVKQRSAEFAVTNRRVLIKIGLFSHHTVEILLQKVEGIGVDQSVGGRLLGYGTISVTGTGGTKELFGNIANPLEFRKQVQHQATAAADAAVPRAAGASYCTQCGTGNPPGARFCNRCGQPMAGEREERILRQD